MAKFCDKKLLDHLAPPSGVSVPVSVPVCVFVSRYVSVCVCVCIWVCVQGDAKFILPPGSKIGLPDENSSYHLLMHLIQKREI